MSIPSSLRHSTVFTWLPGTSIPGFLLNGRSFSVSCDCWNLLSSSPLLVKTQSLNLSSCLICSSLLGVATSLILVSSLVSSPKTLSFWAINLLYSSLPAYLILFRYLVKCPLISESFSDSHIWNEIYPSFSSVSVYLTIALNSIQRSVYFICCFSYHH